MSDALRVEFPEFIHVPQTGPTSIHQFPHALKSPHSQAWSIPEEFDLHSLPLRTSDSQLLSMTLAMWQEYMLHDEILNAISFLEKSPYRIRNNGKILQALQLSKESIAWMDDPIQAEYANTASDPNGSPATIECGSPYGEVMLDGQHKARFDWVMGRLPEKFGKLLDLGCQDGTMTNRYTDKCTDVVGVDMNVNNLSIARSVAEKHGLNASYVNSYFSELDRHLPTASFDTVCSTDVYEHLKDPVEDLLKPARKMIKYGGRMLLVTPNGSWLRGDFLPWAHPWLWCESHGSWLSPQNRAHLIAPDIWTIVQHFKNSGWWVKEVAIMTHYPSDTEGQSSICVDARAGAPPNYPGLSVTIVDYDGLAFDRCLEVARDFAKLGHTVRFYSPLAVPSVVDYVEIHTMDRLVNIWCDIFITDNHDTDPYLRLGMQWLSWMHLDSVDQPATSIIKELYVKIPKA